MIEITLTSPKLKVTSIKKSSRARYMPKLGDVIQFSGIIESTHNSRGNDVYRPLMYVNNESIGLVTMNELNNLFVNLIEVVEEK